MQTTTDDKEIRELTALVTRIEDYQRAAGLSDGKFAARYARYVGSAKTWVDRLKARKFADMGEAVPRWINKLRALVTELDGVSVSEVVELPIIRYSNVLWERLHGKTTDRRNGMLVGIHGTGRTFALRHLLKQHPTECVFLSANETWRDSRMEIAKALALAIGKAPLTSAAATFSMVLSDLKFNPTTILIDEAHEGGVQLLKLVKALINETRCMTILSLYTTSWRRLISGSSESYAEAQQLLRRTQRPVMRDWESGVQKEDVAAYLAHKLGAQASELMIDEIVGLVRTQGGISLLDDALELAEIVTDSGSKKELRVALVPAIRELIGQDYGAPKAKEEAL